MNVFSSAGFLLVACLLAIAPPVSYGQEGCSLTEVDSLTVRTCLYGDGETTVILAAGAGQTSASWSPMIPLLSSSFRVMTFDRAGLGGSDQGPTPRSPTRIAQELRRTLDVLQMESPFVLVGHSMGGVHMLSFAEQFPEAVRAVVLLDTPPPGFEEERRTLLTAAEREARDRLLEDGLSRLPEAVALEREGALPITEWEFPDFDRNIPVFVIAADSQNFGPQGSQERHQALWLRESRHWASLSDYGHFEVAEGSGHMVHHDRSAQVAAFIRSAYSRFLKLPNFQRISP